MSFIVSARASTGEIRYRRNTMLGALEQSLALLSSGLADVSVTDLQGRRYEPSEFGRMLSAANSAGTAPGERRSTRAA